MISYEALQAQAAVHRGELFREAATERLAALASSGSTSRPQKASWAPFSAAWMHVVHASIRRMRAAGRPKGRVEPCPFGQV